MTAVTFWRAAPRPSTPHSCVTTGKKTRPSGRSVCVRVCVCLVINPTATAIQNIGRAGACGTRGGERGGGGAPSRLFALPQLSTLGAEGSPAGGPVPWGLLDQWAARDGWDGTAHRGEPMGPRYWSNFSLPLPSSSCASRGSLTPPRRDSVAVCVRVPRSSYACVAG